MKFSKPIKLPIEPIEYDNCPRCGVSLIGEPIPEEHRKYYGKVTNFKREIGQYDMYLDRTVAYCCPDCLAKWDSLTGELIDA